MSKTNSTLIAVYGTLRKGYGNHGYLNGATIVNSGWTDEKYKLTASGIPFVNPNEKVSKVRVEVYDVPNTILPRVDALEGYNPNDHEGSWYKRTPIPVTLDDGSNITASIYFGDKDGNTLIESGDYADYRSRRS